MTVINNLKAIKKKLDFQPSPFGLFFNPFYFARKGLLRHIKKYSTEINGKILDVGCGRKPYKNLFAYSEYIGMDIEQSGHSHVDEDIDVYYDGLNFPFPAESFDNALCNQVLEHVFNPDQFLSEIHRILRPNGKLLLTVPFSWDEHEQPYDYARYSSFGLKSLLEKNGFVIINQTKSVANFLAIVQLTVGYMFKMVETRNQYVNLILRLFYVFPIHLLGGVIALLLPKNADFYLDNVVLVKKT